MAGTATEEPGGQAGIAEVVYPADARIAGRYRIVRFLAAGGSGEVYEAEDLVLGDTVALKTLRTGLETSERAIERLRREIALARRITHRNVCRIHDVGEHDRRVFLTMELIRGETLAERIRRAPLELGEVGAIARQLVAALSAAHAVGVVHRDFKPANVLLAPGPGDVRAVVCDFGLARSTMDTDDRLTNEAALVGTPAYMAPEQVEGRAATPASDIYALGIVLYEMATGTLPFRGDTALATATARLHREAGRPSSIRRDLDPRFDAAIMRCLARDPSQRFERAADVLIARAGGRRWRWPVAAVAVGVVASLSLAPWAGDGGEVARTPARHWPVGIRPARAMAAAHFDQAHAALVADDWTAARALLEQAVAASPDSPVAQAALAEVLASLGFAERARDASRRAMAARGDLAEEPRLFVEAQTALVRGETAAAIEGLRRLVAIAPAERVYRLRLAVALAQDRPGEAVDVLAELGSGRNDAEDIQIDLVRAAIASAQYDPVAQHAYAERAVELATAAHRRHDRAQASIVASSARWSRGDAAGATAAYEAALADALAAGHTGTILCARDGLIEIDAAAGRNRSAIERHGENVVLLRALGDRARLFDELEKLVHLRAAIGRVDDATAAAEEARQIATDLASELHLGWSDAMAAFLALQRGRLADAAHLAELAFQRGRRLGVPGLAGNGFHTWLEALLELDDSGELARAWAARGPSVERLVDGYAALRNGELDRAERIALTLANWHTREGRAAQVVIAHALIKRGRLDAAAPLLDRVTPLLTGDGSSLLARRRLLRARAELTARRGEPRAALAILDGQAAECAAADLRFCEIPSAALAIQLIAPSDPAAARRRATRLTARARALGFHRIAREVTAIVQRNSSADSP